MTAVAVVGLGTLGRPISARLAAAGFDVAGCDPNVAVPDGVRAAATPATAAAGARVACVLVNDDAQARVAVLGEDGVLAGLTAGGVVVLHSTVAPSTVDVLAETCALAGAGFLDAGISGGADWAEAGRLVTVVGGDAEVLERARPVLAAYASDVVHCGPTGTGMAAKLARNLAQYGVWTALYESMELAAAAGVDLERYVDYVRASGLPDNHDVVLGRPSVAPVADQERLAHLRWAVALGAKDLDGTFELAERLGVEVPVGRVARRRYPTVLGVPTDDDA